MTIVIDIEVMAAVLLRRRTSSLNQGPLTLTTGVTLTPPVPPAVSPTVMLIDAVRVRPPPVPVILTVAGPSVAVLAAEKVTVLAFPVVAAGLKLALTPPGKPLALKATLLMKPPL